MENRHSPTDKEGPLAGLSSLWISGGIEVLVVEGVEKGKVLRTEQLPVLIGRAPDNAIYLPLDRKISRQHAKILQEQHRYFLEDLGSSNGTFYQGARISGRVELFHGDHFSCGETTFRFAIKEQDLPREEGATIVGVSPEEFFSSAFATHLREALVVLDMCNSSALASQYGDEQAMKVKRELRRYYLPVIRRWGAQFVKGTGDGYLATFARAHQAVGSSVEVLQHLRTYNAAASTSGQLHLRFGLNFGETMVDADGDRQGNAVNVAFRVEGVRGENLQEVIAGAELLRTEDRIYLTEPLYAELPPAVRPSCQPVGLFALKGISGQHLLYQVAWETVDYTILGP